MHQFQNLKSFVFLGLLTAGACGTSPTDPSVDTTSTETRSAPKSDWLTDSNYDASLVVTKTIDVTHDADPRSWQGHALVDASTELTVETWFGRQAVLISVSEIIVRAPPHWEAWSTGGMTLTSTGSVNRATWGFTVSARAVGGMDWTPIEISGVSVFRGIHMGSRRGAAPGTRVLALGGINAMDGTLLDRKDTLTFASSERLELRVVPRIVYDEWDIEGATRSMFLSAFAP